MAREHSSQHQSLVELSKKLEAQGKPPVEIHEAPLNLEDDDLLEMVNAGLGRHLLRTTPGRAGFVSCDG
jgi:hypothetical protein